MPDARLIELENMLQSAAKSLRCAWRSAKRLGMEATAKELADTVLDVETSAQQVTDALDEQTRKLPSLTANQSSVK